MMHMRWTVLGLLLTAMAASIAGSAAGEKRLEIKGWGEWTDPDGDCRFRENGGTLALQVPGGNHDFGPLPKYRINGPRVLQKIEGDFSVEVRVSGVIAPDKNPNPLDKTTLFRAGTLLIWQDSNNFVRLDRAGMVKDGKVSHFAYYHVFKDGKRVYQHGPNIEDKVTVLKIQRTGKTIHASVHQGKSSLKLPEQTVDFPALVQVGVGAINTSQQALEVEFDDFKLTRTQK